MSTLSPNMSLVVPTSGVTTGPQYALDINTSLSLVDLHDHTPGKGVPITTAGLNINSTLSLNNNLLTNSAGLTFLSQGSTPAVRTIYNSGSDLYFVDGVGNNIRITQSGGIAGSPGSIANLTSPASASYVSLNNTFVWQSNVNTAANMDVGSILIREVAASANAITIASPTGLSSAFQLTLPAALPPSQKFLALDATGNITAPYSVDNSTIEISSNIIQVKDGGITTAKIANNGVETINIIDAAVTANKLASGAVTTGKIAGGAVGNTQLAPSAVSDSKVSSAASIQRVKLAPAPYTSSYIVNGTYSTGSNLHTGSYTFPSSGTGVSDGMCWMGLAAADPSLSVDMKANSAGTVILTLTVNGTIFVSQVFYAESSNSRIPVGSFYSLGNYFPQGTATVVLAFSGTCTGVTVYNLSLKSVQG